MSSLASQRRGQIGVNAVERVVLRDWGSRWQALDAQNDDGVDGLIFIERGGEATGQVVYVQVKCRTARTDSKDRLCVSGTPARLAKSLERWRRLVGAAILVHVDPATLAQHWVNLRDPGALSGSQIFVPRGQPFNRAAKRAVSMLCGNIHRDLLAERVAANSADFSHVKTGKPLLASARRLYRELRDNPVYLADGGPLVRFTRDGWRHITRPERPALVRHQSLVLLGVARRMLENTPVGALKSDSSGREAYRDVVTACAAVTFPFRQTGIVKIALLPHNDGGYVFHTIYEPRRRRDVLGARQPLL